MENIIILCFLLSLIVVIDTKPLKEMDDLYSTEDNVERLNIDNFKQKTENSSHAWIVEFYVNWCGDCQRFAPIWKDFATDIFGWRDLVQAAVLDCSDDNNIPICREYEVAHYPDIRYFPENYQMSLGMRDPDHGETVEALRHHLLRRIMTEIHEGRGAMYPNLLPYQNSSFSELFRGIPNDTNYVFLVVQLPGGHLGAEVAMDLHRTPGVAVRYAFPNNTELVEKLSVKKFPVIIVVNSNKSVEIIPGNPKSRKEVKEFITEFLKEKGVAVVEEVAVKNSTSLGSITVVKSVDELKERVKKMGNVVFQKDLEGAVSYSLTHEISGYKIIKDEKLDALKAYLQVLKKYFPFGYRSTSFLTELTKLTSADSVEGWRIAEVIQRAKEDMFSSNYGFLGCQGSSPRFRGYPCSLWQLFHYLTVNAENETNPKEILNAVHGYVKHFFGCDACSQHFQEMVARRNMSEVSSLDESILWLWMAHNEVNERLKGSLAEDPEYPKQQFPIGEACPHCTNEDKSWNEDSVLQYLKEMYANFNIRYLGSNTRILFYRFE